MPSRSSRRFLERSGLIVTPKANVVLDVWARLE